MFEVYDDRTNEVVFQSPHRSACIDYLNGVDEDSEEFNHLWLR
ncbi:hypothetical protein J2T13_000847 [Paenibacillus sp. DS2015]